MPPSPKWCGSSGPRQESLLTPHTHLPLLLPIPAAPRVRSKNPSCCCGPKALPLAMEACSHRCAYSWLSALPSFPSLLLWLFLPCCQLSLRSHSCHYGRKPLSVLCLLSLLVPIFLCLAFSASLAATSPTRIKTFCVTHCIQSLRLMAKIPNNGFSGSWLPTVPFLVVANNKRGEQ